MNQEQASLTILEDSQKDAGNVIRYKNVSVKTNSNVFSPQHFNGWKIFTKNFPNFKSKKILEIGTGTGITSIYLANNGAKEVLAADINPSAVKNCKENIKRNDLANMKCIESDVFSNITDTDFDIIYWNLPFMWKPVDYAYASELEKGLFDPGYKLLQRFLSEAPRYINENGKIILGFADFGDEEKLKDIVQDKQCIYRLLAHEKSTEINPVFFSLYEIDYLGEKMNDPKIFYSMPFSAKKYSEIINERHELRKIAKKNQLVLFEQFEGIEKETPFKNHGYQPEFIVKKDLELIKQSDLVIADYSDNSIGRDFEIAYAKNTFNKTVISIFPEEKCHPWVTYHSDVVVKNRNEAFKKAKSILKK